MRLDFELYGSLGAFWQCLESDHKETYSVSIGLFRSTARNEIKGVLEM